MARPKEKTKAILIWRSLETQLDDRGAFNGWDAETLADMRSDMIEAIGRHLPNDE